MSNNPAPLPYLQPYLKAAERHGAGFGSLLWASPETQAARFGAIERLGRLHGKSVLDVGCGRADLLVYLLSRGVRPADVMRFCSSLSPDVRTLDDYLHGDRTVALRDASK